MPGSPGVERARRDLCPGVLRPWPASDGALVRLRLVGGQLPPAALAALSRVAAEYGDGDLHLTGRANLQLRALPAVDGALPAELVTAIEDAGLLPSRTHDLVRNIMVSPLSGVSGGRGDLRPSARDLDDLLVADPTLATLPGRFLFVLADGRGDLVGRDTDLGAVLLDAGSAQLRLGSRGWGEVVGLPELARHLVDLARGFVRVRGDGPEAPWHLDELSVPFAPAAAPDPRTRVRSEPLPFGRVPGAVHVEAPGGVLDPALVSRLVDRAGGHPLVVTPWRGVLVPEAGR